MSSLQENLNTLSRFCAYQERCTQDVLQKMSDLGISQEQRQDLLKKLKQENFLDDQRFATAFVRGKFKLNQWGKMKIKAGLYQKGIPAEILNKALKEIDLEDYFQLAQSLAEKQLPKIKAKNDFEKKQKLHFFLSQRGFESEIITNLKI
jgi:regulatory protein